MSEVSPLFSYAQVEAVLVALHRIADDKRVAFMSRLKHLQKYGLPDRERTGRGRSAAYSFSQLMQLVAGVEMLQAGLPPQRAAEVVLEHWREMVRAITVAAKTEEELDEEIAVFARDLPSNRELGGITAKDMDELWLFGAEALADLARPAESVEEFVPQFYSIAVGIADRALRDQGRRIIIPGSVIARRVIDYITGEMKYTSLSAIRSHLNEVMEPLIREEHDSSYANLMYSLECDLWEDERHRDSVKEMIRDNVNYFLAGIERDISEVSEGSLEFLKRCPQGRIGGDIDPKVDPAIMKALQDEGLVRIDSERAHLTTAGIALWMHLTGLELFDLGESDVGSKA